MSTLTTLKLSDLEIVHDEPRIADLKLAKALAYKDDHKIRSLIQSNLSTLSRFGEVSAEERKPTNKGGRPSTVYFLNEKQALYIIAKSNTPTAAEMTVAMVEVFHAYRHGHLQPTQPMPATFPTTMYAKTLLEDGTEGNPATTKQVGRVLGELSKLTKILDDLDGHLSLMNCGMQSMNETIQRVDEKIRVYAVDSDTIASMDWVFSNSLETLMKHKSYKDGTIQRLKDENASLKKSIALVVANQNRAD
jgi:hypothetical protein